MTKPTLNKKQELFVNTVGHNVLVSASAGSGKTTTMIEKLKKLILEDFVPVENLLVVTFTESAASEMKQKLYFKLQNEIAGLNLDEKTMEYFYEQLFKISTADIGTLHSVCKKIVSKYFYEVNIEPAFSILANEEHETLFNQALNKVLQNYVEAGDEEYYELYECFNDKRNNTKIKSIVTRLFNFLSEKSEPEQYIDYCLNTCLSEDVNTNICAQFLLKHYKGVVFKFLESIKKYQSIVDEEKLNTYFTLMIAQLQTLLNANTFVEFIASLYGVSYPTLNKPKNPDYYDLHTNIKLEVNEFKDVLSGLKNKVPNYTTQQFDDITKQLKKYVAKFFEISLKVDQEFSALKHNIGKLDFSDLQKYAYKILQNKTICEEVKNNYKFVFVDEYQDINQIQEDILNLISNSSNLNMIGDIKQSIYAFRQCMPEIFLSKYYLNINKNDDSLILLNENYRCSKDVVDFVNLCFNTLITEETIGINYQRDSQLVCGSGNSGNVSMRFINCKNKTKQDADENDEDDVLENNQAEAQQVVDIIFEVYGKEYYNDATKQNSTINYKDIAILVRDAKGYVNTLYNTLKAHNIPVSTTLKTSLFNTTEVKVLHSLVKLMANSSSDIDICNVLLSPLIQLSYVELAQIRTEYPDDSYYVAVNNYILFGKNKQIVDKLVQYYALIDDLRFQLNCCTIMEVVDNVVLKNKLKEYYLSLPNGAEKSENIEQFIALLNNAGFEHNLGKCLEFLDSLSSKDDFLINVESGENSVKILTMHKSKGLEYPCVILSNLGKKFNTQIYREQAIFTNQFGVGINYRNFETRKEISTIQKTASVLYSKNQEQEEQIRLLYVALTRARNFLYLTGCYDFSTFVANNNKPIFSSKNFLELIFKALPKQTVVGLANALQNIDVVVNNNKIANIKITNIEDVLSKVEAVENKIIISKADESVVKKMLDNFEKVKPKQSQMLATKNSVTGLMRESDYVNENELSLTIGFSENLENQLPLKVGTAYHKIMQTLQYSETKEQVCQVIETLFKNGELDLEIKPYIDVNKVYNAKQNVLKLLAPTTKILKEQQFLFKTKYNDVVETSDITQPILIQGVVDLILINGDEAILIDFKTNKTKDIAKLINAYSLQLEVYKQAVTMGLNVKVISTRLYLFETATFVEIV